MRADTRIRLHALIWAILSVGMSNCGDGTLGADGQSTEDPSRSVEQSQQQPNGIPPVPVGEGTGPNLTRTGADDLFVEWLADGSFSFLEYETAVLEYVQCMTSSAFRTRPGYPRLTPWDVYQVKFADIEPTELEAAGVTQADLQTAIRSCGQRFWQPASRLWHLTHVPSVSYEQNARELIAACLRLNGVDIPEHPSEDELRRLFDESIDARRDLGTWSTCIREVEEEYFITGTGLE